MNIRIDREKIMDMLRNRKFQAGAAAVAVAAIVGITSFYNTSREIPVLPEIMEPGDLEAEIQPSEVYYTNQPDKPGTTTKTKKSTSTTKKQVKLKTASKKTQTKNLGTKTTKSSNTKKTNKTTTVKTDVTKAVTTTEKYVKNSKIKTVTTKTVTTTKTTTTVVKAVATPAAVSASNSAAASTGTGSAAAQSSSAAQASAAASSAPAGEVKVGAIAGKMPSNVLNAYESLGFKIIVEPGSSASGFFSAKTRSITLRNSADNTIYHELGHFIAFAAGNVDLTTGFSAIYAAEKNSFNGKNKIYAQQKEAEFFAECVREYIVGDNAGLKATCPQTYAAIESAISKITDSQVAKLKVIYKSVWS